ncbi:transcription factor SRM1-like [Vicia villosa]|uniref:transcription factor SRM1-like n=1 Tax=Vicia villosa TaxID=3911 RepID=UPI00273ADF1F|nr:transcription factor SRM1-like [Vicia villosa]XP_058747598.1 transcription factor SRM1-like [Vicia villosa]XP_058747599.1 transcription factor SRM1-like [Vicia villosa]XP_058747600.1 transcription factor SRM1-like [Vicia villosa]
MGELGGFGEWSKEQDMAFENALANYPEDAVDRWAKIAAVVAGKTSEEVKRHYEVLVEDVSLIESGYVALPGYDSPPEAERSTKRARGKGVVKKGASGSKPEPERRKGIPWTEEEHRLFLIGLEKYGDGDWRSISRRCVVTRTPTQVASHAQKYKIRLKSMNERKDKRRRSSIHDITLEKSVDIPGPQVPITGQSSDPAASSAGESATQVPPGPATEMIAAAAPAPAPAGMNAAAPPAEMNAAAAPAGIRTLDIPPAPPAGIRTVDKLPAPPAKVCAAPGIWQPVGGPVVSADGTPVNQTASGHTAYGHMPVSGTAIQEAPMNFSSLKYLMKHTSTRS